MAVLAMAACSNDSDEIATKVTNDKIDASKIQFNITVNNADDGAQTRAVKTSWENGDVVYVFFEDNTSMYVKMTFNGSTWTYSDRSGNQVYSGLTLATSGKKLSAVYQPSFTFGSDPQYNSSEGRWTFGPEGYVSGYFLKAERTDYTVTQTNDVTTLNATIDMYAPNNLVQVYIPTADVLSPKTSSTHGNEYVLNMTNVKSFKFKGIASNGEATVEVGGTPTYPLTGYHGSMKKEVETGYYFWGILANTGAGKINYNFQLVERNAEKKYAISSKSMTFAGEKGKSLTGPTAIKLTGDWQDNGNFVSLGYKVDESGNFNADLSLNTYDSPLWATGNLGRTDNANIISSSNGTIVSPLEAGDYFKYGYTNTMYVYNSSTTSGIDVATAANSNWRMPTKNDFDALKNDHTTEKSWKNSWTNIGPDNYGEHLNNKSGILFTSKVNGISLFFAAAGYYSYDDTPQLKEAGNDCRYWSSSESTDKSKFWSLFSEHLDNTPKTSEFSRAFGHSVRPVTNPVKNN